MNMKRISALLLALALTLSLTLLAGCKKDSNSGDQDQDDGPVNVEDVYGTSELSADVIEALQNSGAITLYTTEASVAQGKLDEEWQAGMDWYKKYYGLTINWKYQAYGDDLKKFLVDFAANDAPDLIYLDYRRWPKAGLRQVIYNLDELKEMEVLGLDHPAITTYEDLSSRFEINGKKYAVSVAYASPTLCCVNLDLFDQYSVKSPMAYYQEGDWTMDTYIKCAKDITRTLSDGTKIWGTFGWNYSWYLVANDCRLVQWDDKYNLKLTMTSDPKTVETLTTFQDIYEKGYCPSSEEYSEKKLFTSGKEGMVLMTADNMAKMVKDVTFKWDILPMPLGANNSSGETAGEVSGWGLVSSSKNPQGAINYIIAKDLYNKQLYKQDWGVYFCPSYDGIYSEEQIDTIANYADHIGLDLYMGVGDLNTKQWNFWNDLKRGTMTVKEVFDTHEGVFQEQIDAENAMAKKD